MNEITETERQESLMAHAQITHYEAFLIALFMYWNYPIMTADERRDYVSTWRGKFHDLREIIGTGKEFPRPDDPLWLNCLEAIGVVSTINMSATV